MNASLLPLVLIVMIGWGRWAPRDGWARRDPTPERVGMGQASSGRLARGVLHCLQVQVGECLPSVSAASSSVSPSEMVIEDLGEASCRGEPVEGWALLQEETLLEEAGSDMGRGALERW